MLRATSFGIGREVVKLAVSDMVADCGLGQPGARGFRNRRVQSGKHMFVDQKDPMDGPKRNRALVRSK